MHRLMRKTMGEDNQFDHSMWMSFFNDNVVFFNNDTIKQMIRDLGEELKARSANEESDSGNGK